MQALNTYINAINAHIDSSIAISEAQAAFVTAYNAMTWDEQGEARDAIARVISQRTKVKALVMSKGSNKGRLGFKAKHAGGTDKSEAARKMFEYYLPVVEKPSTKKPSTKKTVRKSVDPVAELLKKFQSLTAAQKRAFLKAV